MTSARTATAEPLRLLLVEDSPEDAALLEATLRDGGFAPDIVRVTSEPDFRAAVGRGGFDLVILDYSLPGFDARRGLDVLREAGGAARALVVSGTVGEEDLVETMRAGAVDYVQKENLSRLVPAVRRELREAAARRQRERAESALREMEERFRFVLDQAGGVFYRLRYADMRYEFMSPGIEQLTGYHADELRSLDFNTLITAVTEAATDQHLGVGEPRLSGRTDTYTADYEFKTRTGDRKWVSVHSFPWLDEAGAVQGAVGIMMDITERRVILERLRKSEAHLRTVLGQREHAEAALRRSEEHFRSLIENASDLIVVTDAGGGITYLSPSVERVLGHRTMHLLGGGLLELVHPEDQGRLQQALADAARRGTLADPMAVRLGHADGSWRTAEVLARRQLADRGEGLVITARDITERETLEAQLLQAQKIEAVGRLAGGIAHDFNNLVTAILGYADLLARRLPAADALRRHVEEITRAAERAASLTQQLLAFSRKQVLQPRVLDVREVLESAQGLLRRLIGEDIELIILADAAVGRVRADPVQLEQVLLNLAINARDAMPQGGRLVLEAADVDFDETYAREHVGGRPGPFVMIAVSDTGHGMDRETQARIFEPFFTTKEMGKGTGLGLSTVYGIVKQSGGYIWVYSEPGRGTTFKVYLPRVAQPAAEDTARVPATGPVAGGSETVLLVEDEDSVRELVEELLRAAGYDVLTAGRPADALRLADDCAGPLHLLITDVVMPQMAGPDLARRLRGMRPGLKVLYLSGYSPGIVADRGVLEEGAMFLQKPFSAEALETKVRETLDAPS
ncbi:MAG TPA: PAS domain S-box protein [Vicinamibacteria bacterium]